MNNTLGHRRRITAGLALPAFALIGGLLGAQPLLANGMGSHFGMGSGATNAPGMGGMGMGQMDMSDKGMGPQGMGSHGMGPGGMADADHDGRFAMHQVHMARGDHAERRAQRRDQSWHQPLQGKDVTVGNVTEFLEARLKRMDNPRLKVGDVTAKDDKVIQGDIVTVDNSLVWRFEFDRASGRMQPVK